MARIAVFLAALGASLVAAVPAGAFSTCTYDAGTKVVTATRTNNNASRLLVGPGGEIRAALNGGAPGNCSTATVTNTDVINIVGAAEQASLYIDLSGGAFAPGLTDEGDGSSEIEINVDAGADFYNGFRVVSGAAGSSIVAGKPPSGSGADRMRVNLNAAADGATPDVDLTVNSTSGFGSFNFAGGTGADDVSCAGGGPLGGAIVDCHLAGGEGDDKLTGTAMTAGPGDDEFTGISHSSDRVRYFEAVAGIEVQMPGGTLTGKDGHGGTDTYHGVDAIEGTPFADRMIGDELTTHFAGLGGADFVDAKGGRDYIEITGAGAVAYGGAGGDQFFSVDQGAIGYGEDGPDSFWTYGNAVVHGGPGNDYFGEGDYSGTQTSDGGQTFHGGDGIDTVSYADPSISSFGQPVARDYAVSVTFDGVANDGEIDLPEFSGDENENDNVMPDVENAYGGFGDDVLVGDEDANVLRGVAGIDTMVGNGGNDDLSSAGANTVDDKKGDTLEGGAGLDKIRGSYGKDTIRARDGEADDIVCFDEIDLILADQFDVFANDCESPEIVDTDPPGTGGGADGGTGGGGPGGGQTGGGGQPGGGGGAAAPTFAGVVTLPKATRKCVSRRNFKIRLQAPAGDAILSATVSFNGKKVKTVKGDRVTAQIDLRGLPKGRVTVKIVVKLESGKTLSGSRKYRTCVPRKKKRK